MGHVQAVWTEAEVDVTLQYTFQSQNQSIEANLALLGCVTASSSVQYQLTSTESNTQQSEVKFIAVQVAEKLIFLVSPRSNCCVFLSIEQGKCHNA